jgi:hypothetical protein
MMRRTRTLSAIALATMLVLVTILPVMAGSTTKSLSTNFTLVNLGSGAANGTIEYYETDGSAWGDGSEDFTITNPGGQAIFRQYFPNGSPGNPNLTDGRGSVVIESSEPLGAVVQIQARAQDPTSNGAYSGFSAGAASFYVPLAARNLATASGLSNSQIIVQNTGTIPADLEIEMVNPDGSTRYTKTMTGLQPAASYYYDLADESASNVPDLWYGSAVARTTTSGASIAVVSNYFSDHAMQTFNGFTSSAGAGQYFVPLFTSRLANSMSTPVSIQNVSGGTIAVGDVDMSCVPDPALSGYTPFTLSNTTAILDRASYYFNPVTDTSIPTGFYGSCVIDSTADVVAFVQMRYIDTGEAAAYEAIPGGTDTEAFIPLAAKRLVNGFATAITIQNLSTTTVFMDLTYNPSPEYVASGGSATPVQINDVEVGPRGSLIQNLRVESGPGSVSALPNGWYGTLTVDSSEAIGSFVQLTFARFINPSLPGGDNFMAHNGFTQP